MAFSGQVVEKADGVAGFGELALDVDDAEGCEDIQRAHGVEVEALDGFDLVAEEIDAGGKADLVAAGFEIAGEIDVDDSAAHGEIARHFNLVEAVVTMFRKPDDQLFRLKVIASLEVQHEPFELLS